MWNMTEILAVFRSRTQAIDCIGRLRAMNVPAKLVNTPREAGAGCGLSVAFGAQNARKVKTVIAGARYSAFYGYLSLPRR